MLLLPVEFCNFIFIKNIKMKTRLLLSILLLLSIFNVYSQQIPFNFSTDADSFIGFDGSSFAFRTDLPSSSSNRGGQFFNSGSNASQGFYIDLNQPIVLSEDNKVFTLLFYSFDPNNHNILLKLEDDANTNVEVKTTFGVPSPSDWTTVSFDFSNAQNSSNGNTIDASGSYSRITLLIDEGTTTPGTYIIDDISNGSISEPPTNPNEIDVVYNDLVWSDEFDINGAIDTDNWFHQTQLPAGGNWFNGEQQHYTNRIENSFVENGFLNIVAIFEGRIADGEGFTDQGETKEYTSARLNSKFAFTYGRVDVRAKLPFGDGTWPAIWTLGKNINEDGAYWDNQGFGTTNWPATGEIDIMEHGLGAVNHVSSALHTPCGGCFGATMNFQSYVLNDVANTFHVYSVNWSPEKIVFLIDNIPFYTYNPADKESAAGTWPFIEDQYLLLNIAMGGIAGTPDPNFIESSMVIDYVRVYQNSSLSTEDFSANTFSVYPNPSKNIINIKGNTTINNIKLYNMLGELVLHKKGNVDTIHVSKFNRGIYILKIQSDNSLESKKVYIN